MRPITLLAALALAGAGAACARQADTAAEDRVIRDLDKKWVAAVAAKDTVMIGSIFAEDGEFLGPNTPRVTGRAAVRAAWARVVQLPHLALTFEPAKIVVSNAGDIAYETGTYKFAVDGPKGKRIEDVGKYVVAWKRVNAEWKVQYDIFNSDQPAAM